MLQLATPALRQEARARGPTSSAGLRITFVSWLFSSSTSPIACQATVAAYAYIPATREAVPTRTLRCVSRPGCGRREEERRPAGAGLGGVTMARVLAQAAGRPTWRRAAPSTATVGGGGERPRNWRVPRGSPDWWSRPLAMLLLMWLDLGVAPLGRREEPSPPSALPQLSIGIVGRRRTS